jgi:hypothetical protein
VPVGTERTAARRHPQDPDPTRSTKALAVVWLAAIGLLFSPVVAGALPAGFALLLARSTEAEMRASGGFLTGVTPLRVGTRLARLALLVAVAVIVIGIVFGIFHLGGPGDGDGVRYGSDVN